MFKQKWTSVLIVLVGVVWIGIAAQSFTTLNVRQYHGKTRIPQLTAALDANFAQLAATGNPTFAAITGTDKLSVQSEIAGASAGHIIKNTYETDATSSGTQAGLIIKAYDETNTVHNGGEFAGLYINVKNYSDPIAGGETALITAHNYGSGGLYQVIDYGVVLYGDLREGVKLTGGTSEYALSCVDQTITIAEFEGSNGETISNVTDGQWALSGTLTAPALTPVIDATTSRVITSADYGKVIMLSSTNSIAVTLPANGAAAGSWVDVMTGAGSDDNTVPTISAATADTLVGPGDQDLDSVTWGSGHRIGAYAKFISDGSFWHVHNLGGTTMTYTD